MNKSKNVLKSNKIITGIENYTIIILFLFALSGNAQDLKLWYETPANEWMESLPIGNGRLLATNEGGVYEENINLNEETIWSGRAGQYKDNPEGALYLDTIRGLIFEGKYADAEKLVKEKMSIPWFASMKPGFVARSRNAYQSLGNLRLIFDYKDNSKVENYKRELDLDRAVSAVSYSKGNVTYSRQFFASHIDQSIFIKLDANKQGEVNFDAVFTKNGAKVELVDSNKLVIRGSAFPELDPTWKGVKYECQIEITTQGGKIIALPNGFGLRESNSVILKIVANTDYKNEEPHVLCTEQLDSLKSKSFNKALEDHIKEHQRLFHRVSLNLVKAKSSQKLRLWNTVAEELPTDKRIKGYGMGIEDAGLLELYFQFGRYILMSCSRPKNMAINLWGKWINNDAPWFDADYHTNINVNMNYWPALNTNLAECHTPFFDLIDSLRISGRKTAKITYGSKGFTSHIATDAWYYTAAVGNPTSGMWPMTPAWGAHQMWQYYLYGLDKNYLKETTYPIMKEASEFFVDYLVKYPRTGKLVTGPSTSPENAFLSPNGNRVSVSMGPTMDMQLVTDLFTNTIAATKVLNVDKKFRKKLEKMASELQPMQIGADGRLQEWIEPFEELKYDVGHKHVSHLWGLCEGSLITPDGTPELAEAALKSLDYRVKYGSAETPVFRGNTAWIIKSYVRLKKADDAYKHIKYVIANSSYSNLFANSYQGIDRKMWETDANLGITAAIAEMFVQSRNGIIELLPALPSAFPEGEVKGLTTQGAFEVAIKWGKEKLINVTIKSKKGALCKLKYGDKYIEFQTIQGKEYQLNGSLLKM